MAKSYFAVLEITPGASPDEVRAAYRRLAKAFHPDYYKGGCSPFQQIQEAYSVLGDPDKREAYEKKLSGIPVRRAAAYASYPEPEPLCPYGESAGKVGPSPVRFFNTFSPAVDTLFEWMWNNHTGGSPVRSAGFQHLTMDVPLTREQAFRGGRTTVEVPARTVCPACRGYGNTGYYRCHRCAGQGAISGAVPISIAFPAGTRKDISVKIPLDRFGIGNLCLTVRFRLRDFD